MFDLSINNILHSNLVNFIIMVILLWYLLKGFISDTIKNLQANTQNKVENSENILKQAENNFSEAKKSYEKLPEEKADIEENAKRTLISLEKKSKNDIEKSKNIIISNFDKILKSETDKKISDLTKETVNNSMSLAKEKVKAKLTPEMHVKLIEEAIENL